MGVVVASTLEILFGHMMPSMETYTQIHAGIAALPSMEGVGEDREQGRRSRLRQRGLQERGEWIAFWGAGAVIWGGVQGDCKRGEWICGKAAGNRESRGGGGGRAGRHWISGGDWVVADAQSMEIVGTGHPIHASGGGDLGRGESGAWATGIAGRGESGGDDCGRSGERSRARR
jgi:hypothetical protein